MPNKRYSERAGDQDYEGEQGTAGLGKMQGSGAVDQHKAGTFAPRESVNPMKGDGSKMPQQAHYKKLG